MIDLLDALIEAASEVRQFVNAYGDAQTMPGRVPDVDADGTGRLASRDPGRPTERTALDERRQALTAELKSGAAQLPYAVAVVRGVSASMDRALARWEGEDTAIANRGDSLDRRYRSTEH
ncbi:hypothetical protein ABTY96_03170 [Streptomyces sp. NPDC096057]|uniref:DUF7169 domain-containing protein n=1 Tax=Streptomyces sp. NPDC096057 TaxID=3155543 RepID=UPI003329CD0B